MIKNLLYVVTDGILDDLARKAIIGASNIYKNNNPVIHIYSLNSIVPLSDPLFESVPDEVRINQVSLTEESLTKMFPNIMTKKLVQGSKMVEGLNISHWDNAKKLNQHLAEFSDLAIFYFMNKFPNEEFLYMDTDILPMKPIPSGNNFIVAKDLGFDGKEYINSSFIYVPKGYTEIKERWITFLENDILESYAGRYGMPGPIAFDKFLGRDSDLLGFPLTILGVNELNPLSFMEVFKSASIAFKKQSPMLIDIDHDGPGLNIPRSAITSVFSAEDIPEGVKMEIELLLGLVNPHIGAQVLDFMFYPKGVSGINYYE